MVGDDADVATGQHEKPRSFHLVSDRTILMNDVLEQMVLRKIAARFTQGVG